MASIEGLEETIANFEDLKRTTQKNVVRRALVDAGQQMAHVAAQLAPVERGVLAFSIVVATQLTSRHRAEQRDRESEVEVYIGPAGGQGALNYASFVEFGTIDTRPIPYLRPAFESTKEQVFGAIVSALKVEVDKATLRASRKITRFLTR